MNLNIVMNSVDHNNNNNNNFLACLAMMGGPS